MFAGVTFNNFAIKDNAALAAKNSGIFLRVTFIIFASKTEASSYN